MKNQTRRKSSDTGSRRRSDNDYSSGSSGHNRRSSVYDNRGSSFNDDDGRFNQNYGYGSQQDNEDYRDFSSQGRNSGLGNQGGYSTYGPDQDYRYDESYGSQYHSEGRDWESNRGKGPKGYTRSDERIQEDVNDILSEDHHLDASQIEVSVEKGEVTLSGTVASRQDKRHAEDIIEHVSGVKNVENRIKVSSSSSLKKNKDSESATSKASETPASKTKQTNGVHV